MKNLIFFALSILCLSSFTASSCPKGQVVLMGHDGFFEAGEVFNCIKRDIVHSMQINVFNRGTTEKEFGDENTYFPLDLPHNTYKHLSLNNSTSYRIYKNTWRPVEILDFFEVDGEVLALITEDNGAYHIVKEKDFDDLKKNHK